MPIARAAATCEVARRRLLGRVRLSVPLGRPFAAVAGRAPVGAAHPLEQALQEPLEMLKQAVLLGDLQAFNEKASHLRSMVTLSSHRDEEREEVSVARPSEHIKVASEAAVATTSSPAGTTASPSSTSAAARASSGGSSGSRSAVHGVAASVKAGRKKTHPLDAEGAALRPEHFTWSNHAFNDGEEGNAGVLRRFEDEYAKLVAAASGNLEAPGLLKATLDLAGAYVKSYSLDKADLLLGKVVDMCRARGAPWDVKCLQDLATLRFKQNRQPESAELLEELASRVPPNAALQENLGIVHNALGNHSRALACFQQAVVSRGGVPSKEDLWNMALAKKNLGDTNAAIRMMESVLDRFHSDEEATKCPVTFGKVHDSLADCYLTAHRPDDATHHYEEALDLFKRHVGARSPLFQASANSLSKALLAAGRRHEAFDALVLSVEVLAEMDAIHPTPLYEQLQRALELRSPAQKHHDGAEREEDHDSGVDQEEATDQDVEIDLRRLVPAVQSALKNLEARGWDKDGNGGVVMQKLAEVLLAAADRETLESDGGNTVLWRRQALEMLRRSKKLMQDATDAEEADLSELCLIAAMQIGLTEASLSSAAAS